MASDLPVGVFSAGNDKDTFSFAKGFFYPSFLSLEEEEVVIRPTHSQAIIGVHALSHKINMPFAGSVPGPSELTLPPPPPSWAAALLGLGLPALPGVTSGGVDATAQCRRGLPCEVPSSTPAASLAPESARPVPAVRGGPTRAPIPEEPLSPPEPGLRGEGGLRVGWSRGCFLSNRNDCNSEPSQGPLTNNTVYFPFQII